MTLLEIILLMTTLILLIGFGWVSRLLYKTGVIVLNVQDTLEDSLEILDERIQSIDKVLEIPLFSDSPEIKSLQRDMITCREAILDIAFSLSNSMDQQDPNEQLSEPQ